MTSHPSHGLLWSVHQPTKPLQAPASELCCIATHCGAVKFCRKRPEAFRSKMKSCVPTDGISIGKAGNWKAEYWHEYWRKFSPKVWTYCCDQWNFFITSPPKKRKHTIPLVWNGGTDCLIFSHVPLRMTYYRHSDSEQLGTSLSRNFIEVMRRYRFNGTKKKMETEIYGNSFFPSSQ